MCMAYPDDPGSQLEVVAQKPLSFTGLDPSAPPATEGYMDRGFTINGWKYG